MLKIHLEEVQMFHKFGWGKLIEEENLGCEIIQYTRAQPEMARPAPPPLSCNKYIVKCTSEHVPYCQSQLPVAIPYKGRKNSGGKLGGSIKLKIFLLW